MDDLTPCLDQTDGPAPPAGLFAPRTRSRLVGVGSDWPSVGLIGLPVARSHWGDVLANGAVIDRTAQIPNKLFIPKSLAVDSVFQPFVPLLARKHFSPMRVEMHPLGMWGASLIHLFDEGSHRALRKQAYLAAGYICEACGSGHGAMEAWELWSYDRPDPQTDRGVMRLKRLLCLCHECHDMCRLDRVGKAERAKAAYQRMQTINGWSEQDFLGYLDWARRLYHFRSRFRWSLDLTAVSHFMSLSLGKAWRSDSVPDTYVATTSSGQVRAHVIGLTPKVGEMKRLAPAQQQDLFASVEQDFTFPTWPYP